MSPTTTIQPRAFSLIVGHLVIAEGMRLSKGMFLVMFLEEGNQVRMLSEEDMVESIEGGAKLRWS